MAIRRTIRMVPRGFVALTALLLAAACSVPQETLVITGQSQEDGATDVAIDASVSASFNLALDAESGADGLSLSRDGADVPGVVAYDAATRTLTLTPTAQLSYATTYLARVSTDVRSTHGGSLSADWEWSFTTAVDPDADPDPALEPLTASDYLPSSAVVFAAMTASTAEVSGGGLPYTFTVTTGALPAGVSLDVTTGTISGTPTAIGTFTGTVTVTDAEDDTATLAFDITVGAPDLVAADYEAAGTVVDTALAALTADVTGGILPYSFEVTSGDLPPGVTLSVDGTIGGTPATIGAFAGTVTVTDAVGASATLGFDIVVLAPELVASGYEAATILVGLPLGGLTANVTGGTEPYEFELTSGQLPLGVTLAADGTIGGVPLAAGTFVGTVTVTDDAGATATLGFDITVLLGDII